MVEYVAMAKANLAWIAWRQNRLEDCESLGREALELWHSMDDPYSVDWMALWPLIAVAITRGQTEKAVEFARGIFPESQHPIDDEVMSATKCAIDSWKTGDTALAESQMQNALKTAEHHHYI